MARISPRVTVAHVHARVVICSLVLAAVAWLMFADAAGAATARCLPGQASSPRCHVWTGKVVFVADGDTIDVDIAGDGTRAARHVRFTGINAMELRRYSKYASRRRGDCHALEATARAEALIRRSKWKVRLAAQNPKSVAGHRLRRQVSVRVAGRWRDLGAMLVSEGHALWLPNGVEYAWNISYRKLSQRAAARGRQLWDTDYCSRGAAPRLAVHVNFDADGNDAANINGEYVRVRNLSPFEVRLAGWWLRDSALRRFTFPAGAVIPAGGHVTVHVGRGRAGGSKFFWAQPRAAFENPSFDSRGLGDGAYLFDAQGDLRAWDIYPD